MSSILLSKNNQTVSVLLTRLHEWTGARFAPYLEFSCPSLLRRAQKFSSYATEPHWLGKYFEREILTPSLPPVSLRWIDDRMGWGVFAEKALPSNTFIAEYTGIVRRRKRSDRTNAYCFEYVPDTLLIDAQDQGGLSRYSNHSDTPNLASNLAIVDSMPHIVLYTKRAVQKNEELCYDYGPDYWKYRKK